MQADAECQVNGREKEHCPESCQQQRNQAHLEHVSVEHHQQDDDHIEQDCNVLDSVEVKHIFNFHDVEKKVKISRRGKSFTFE